MANPAGPICVTVLGQNWVDGGTLSLTQSQPMVHAGTSTRTNLLSGEGSPIRIVNDLNRHVSVEFEARDLSVGKARYTAGKQVSRNLSMVGSNPIAHANVEVHL